MYNAPKPVQWLLRKLPMERRSKGVQHHHCYSTKVRPRSHPKVNPGKVVLQGKVTKLKQEVRYFDQTFKVIRTAMLDFLNGNPNKTQQFQINGGLISLKSHVDGVLEAMERVSLKEENAGDDKKDDEEDNKVDEESDEESDEELEEKLEKKSEAEEVEEDEEDEEEDEEGDD
ncbi:hypothetical protein N7516_002526 [Penicillium verrucosum]|uniref:uncharacterized protein n=1 Tax=Penicillium verrucosum TaxID=60171 RepID=UPI002545250F|nr:uncharacterized protein N7516_002526 [Penicillium verrucosum]KAJ5942358.1 hypothetical protein N7516_002526 [Penicillium verrucosum]